MKLSSLLKYSTRFLFLQIVLTYTTIFYFNVLLIPTKFCELCVGNSFRLQINSNLWEDRNRFFTFLPERFSEVEYFLGFFIFIFLIMLYSTKFYTYVNELSYSLDRNYLDEYISIYFSNCDILNFLRHNYRIIIRDEMCNYCVTRTYRKGIVNLPLKVS